MYSCAHCTKVGCRSGDRDGAPANCPMREEAAIASTLEQYREGDTLAFFQAAAAVEAEGYREWPRLREVGEFCRKMGYRRVGIAFCVGLHHEAKVTADVLRRFGLEAESVACKTGGMDKSVLGIPQDHYLRPGRFEAMCNPIAQAEFLNRAGTEFNVVVGLCVGHDSLFFKHSLAPVTTLVAKDRVLANNPAGALYCAEGYLRNRLSPTPR